jgi:hypothetical protein
MSIFKDSYQTTVGSAFVTKTIENAIRRALIQGAYDTLNIEDDGVVKPMFITGQASSDADIPLFTHPLLVTHNSQQWLCTDMRMFMKRPDGEYRGIDDLIKNRTEFAFTKSRAVLNLLWAMGGEQDIKSHLPFAGIVFSAWISDVISKTFALDFKDQTTLVVISSYYYQTLFASEPEMDADTKQKMAVHTIKATKAPAQFVLDIFDRIGEMRGIEDYCRTVREILENVRLKDFNLAVLLTIIRNSWYGTNAKEILSVAIEHPPTWNAIVYAALSERTYRSSAIYRVAERFGKRGESDGFIKSYVELIHRYQRPSLESIDDVIEYRDFE